MDRDMSDNSPFPLPLPVPGVYMAGGMVQHRAAPRRAKRHVPDQNKDYRYWEKRKKNNEAAKRSRENRRRINLDIRSRLIIVEEENMLLKRELEVIKTKFNLSLNKRYLSLDSDGELVGDIYTPDTVSECSESMYAGSPEAPREQCGDIPDDTSSHGMQRETYIESSDYHVASRYEDDHNIPMKKRRLRRNTDTEAPSEGTVERDRQTYSPTSSRNSAQCESNNKHGDSAHLRMNYKDSLHALEVKASQVDARSVSSSSGYETGSNGSRSPCKITNDSSVDVKEDFSRDTIKPAPLSLCQLFADKNMLNYSSSLIAWANGLENRNLYQNIPSLICRLMNTRSEESRSFLQSSPYAGNVSSQSNPVFTSDTRGFHTDNSASPVENVDLRSKLLTLANEVDKMKRILLQDNVNS